MTTDDPSRYAPPFELRIPLGTVVDTSDGPAAGSPVAGSAPAPSAIAGASPGATTAAAAPPIAPTLPDMSDPAQVTLLLARMWGEQLTGASIVPVPLPAQVGSASTIPGQAATPGMSLSSGNPTTPGGEPAPSMIPTSATEWATSLAPANVDVPSAAGWPQSPSLGGGLPSIDLRTASGGAARPASAGLAIASGGAQPVGADLTSPASAATMDAEPAQSPFSAAPAFGAVPGFGAAHPTSASPGATSPVATSMSYPGMTSAGTGLSTAPSASSMPSSPAPSTPASSPNAAVPHATNGASTGTTTAGALAPGANPSSPTAPAVPANAGPSATYPTATSGATSAHPTATSNAAPASATYPTATSNAAPATDYRHGGTEAGGHPMYGAPPDLDGFLIEPTAHGLPRFDSALTPQAIAPTSATASPFGSPALPMPDLPEAPIDAPMPSAPYAPSSPMGAPGIPSSSMVPSSSPFGAPLDFGGMLAHPMHAMTVPTLTTPSTGHAVVIEEVDDARLVRELGRQAFDPYSVRKDFPILDEKVHGGKRLVWLDNAATTQKPRQVIDRISYFYAHENSNVHRAAHTLAARSTDAFERARESARRFLNAPSAKEIVWVRGATEGINLIAKSWGDRYIGKDDEIVITHLEHHANIVPWQMLCAAKGARLRVAPVDDRGDVILDAYEKLMGPRTKLVSIPHVSNALGTITPAKQMVDIAHRYGAHVMVDGAQAVSHMKVDVQDLGCEWYVFSGHKVFAPTGIGVVWGKQEVLDASPPWQGGGNMIEDVTFEKTTYQPPPMRFEAGTGSIGDAVGLGAAIEYVERIGMDVIDRYEHEMLVYGTQRLATVPGLTMIGTSPHKAGVLSFVLDGQRTEDVSAMLDKDGIAVRSGHHCAQPILRRYGLEATVRASLAFYNVCEDIDALVEALHRLQAGRQSGFR